jgi:hypothetical protein
MEPMMPRRGGVARMQRVPLPLALGRWDYNHARECIDKALQNLAAAKDMAEVL